FTTPEVVAAGTYRYAFGIGGLQIPDPKATRFAESFRGLSAILDVPGPTVALQTFDARLPHGQVATVDYPSSSLGLVR
ncbi:hypothetical protein NL357_28985, partial [Klebsiella pneumoniae]|nr:hypothetical protein [Klebsiella pneumoniae]